MVAASLPAATARANGADTPAAAPAASCKNDLRFSLNAMMCSSNARATAACAVMDPAGNGVFYTAIFSRCIGVRNVTSSRARRVEVVRPQRCNALPGLLQDASVCAFDSCVNRGHAGYRDFGAPTLRQRKNVNLIY